MDIPGTLTVLYAEYNKSVYKRSASVVSATDRNWEQTEQQKILVEFKRRWNKSRFIILT
jgi:hypothetical protein